MEATIAEAASRSRAKEKSLTFDCFLCVLFLWASSADFKFDPLSLFPLVYTLGVLYAGKAHQYQHHPRVLVSVFVEWTRPVNSF